MSDINKNFGLSESKFSEMLQDLQRGDESLIRLVFTTHFERCRNFLVSEYGASYEDAYDITKDTLIKFRKSLLESKLSYGNLAALFTIDAKNNFLKWKQKQARIPLADVDDSTLQIADDTEGSSNYDEETLDAMKTALKKLGGDCFELITWYYYLDISHKEIADKRIFRGDNAYTTTNAVKTKLSECRKGLKKLMGV